MITGSASMVAEAAHSWADFGTETFLLIADRRDGDACGLLTSPQEAALRENEHVEEALLSLSTPDEPSPVVA